MQKPLIYCNKKKENDSFPLILVIGREANTNEPITVDEARFFFEERRKGFNVWDVAIKLLYYCANDEDDYYSIKRLIRERSSACVIFADISPSPHRNGHRIQFTNNEFQEHINRIVINPLMQRVKLVIFHDPLKHIDTNFPLTFFKQKCDELEISYYETLFFCGNNWPSIKNFINPRIKSQISQIYHEWLQATQN